MRNGAGEAVPAAIMREYRMTEGKRYASQNIYRAGRQADRCTGVGNKQMARKSRIQSLRDAYIYRDDRAQRRGRRLADTIGGNDLV
jgi:hypothetical protein